MFPILGIKIKPGQVRGSAHSVSMPVALSNGVAKGSITVPAAVPAPGTHLKFSAVFGGCVCAAYSDFADYCTPSPAPASPAALANDIADYYNSVADVAQYLYFTAAGAAINYVSILPGLVVTTLSVPGGFVHVQTNNGLIACAEIKPGRAVVTNACRVPTADNPFAIALAASADPGDSFAGISKYSGGCNCKCTDGCKCKCFSVVTSGTVGIELISPPPACPATGPLKLGYSNIDGRFVFFVGAVPADVTMVDRHFSIKMVQGLSALISF